MLIENKKAMRDFHIEHALEVGMCLLGTEVKSIRSGQVNLNDAIVIGQAKSFCVAKMNIAAYQPAGKYNHNPARLKQLLLNKKQMLKMIVMAKTLGGIIVPIKLYDKHNIIKCEIAICKKKKIFDKRRIEKEKEFRKDKLTVSGAQFYD